MVKSKNSTKNSDLERIEQLEMILDNIPGLIFYKDDKNNFIKVNKYIADAHEKTKSELEGVSLFDLYPKEEAQKYFDDDLVVIKSKKPKLNFIEPWDVKEGKRWVNSNKIPLFDENNKCIGIIGFSTDVTAQVKAEQKLKQSQMQLNSILSNIKDSVFVISEDKKILFKNENANSIFGNDLIGRKCFNVIKGREQVCEYCPLQILMTNKECQTRSEEQLLTPMSNEIKIFDIIISSIENYDGRKAYLEVLRDITLLKRNEEKLRESEHELIKHRDHLEELVNERNIELKESEEWLSTTLRSIGDAVIATDSKGNIRFLNPVAESLTGWKQSDAITKPVQEIFNIINENSREEVENPVVRVIREGVIVGLANHTILISKDGREIPIDDSGAPIKDKEGKITGVVLIFRDITSRKKMMEELHLKSISFKSSLSAQSIADINGIINLVNPAFLELWGYKSNEEAIGGSVGSFFVNPDDAVPVLKALSETGEWEGEFLAKKCDGSTFISRGFATAIYNEQGEHIGFQSANLDVTERREAEKQLIEYSENLEEMVKERTKQIQNIQDELVRNERLAVLGQIAGGVGHELRNPLGAIKNATYFLNMVIEEPEPEVKETLEILEREVNSSEKIIDSLLSYARPKSLVVRKIEINEIIREVLTGTLIPKNVEIIDKLSNSLPHILADPDLLKRVFGNIILNAIQAMSKGGQLIIKSEVQNQDHLVISINDSGVGISEENLEKLFKPLFTTKAKGIGLGLAISETIVKKHGGTIEIQSELGRGSTFLIKLPINRMETK